MSRNNKPVSVEINDMGDNLSEVKINKVRLGTIDESTTPLTVRFSDNRSVTAKDFDGAMEMLIAEFNLHH
ncbi:DUF2969 family protein [Weissella cibaria]|uniref:Uncharacterized protein n=1 Tax=Weissella cibaria TaxID=137591 RepID=A0A0D1JK83_9LACO|nr:DUF2969 family protein [Weissella cibaria]KIU21788.1 hypothetical protein QX99_00476 [Weissella cibaria]MDV8929463.1 DUF2969 domain-containing protein [Weissella cibaria]QDG81434.1 DUF2969 family protein [Weissella cibaria]QMU88411.1 DUF2969 domain-containing protein [Weissella cibaria]TVV35447.1 DUF2969 family protein [Weissella cibaria]